MTDNLIAFFYRERLLVAVVSMLITAGGILALYRLNVDAFPDVTPVQVEIDTEAQGLAPQEVEQLITFPIENVMNGITGVVRVQSESKFGLSVVTVYFSDDIDIYFARQQVLERLSLAKDRIPSGFEPEMGPITTGTGQIYLYEITGRGKRLDRQTATAHRVGRRRCVELRRRGQAVSRHRRSAGAGQLQHPAQIAL